MWRIVERQENMMKSALAWIAVFAMGTSVAKSADPTVLLEDARFTQHHDKDHPWGFTPNFTDRPAWENRAETLRRQALVALGLWPMPPKTPLNAVIHGKIDRDAYTIEKVFFASMPGHYVSGNLYRPKNKTGKLPAVLCPYGHWPDGRFIWRDDNGVNKDMASGAEKDPVAARTPLQANLAMLARMGCIVFQYDMVGYCDSTKIPHREGFLDTESLLRLQSFMGLQTWNSIRSMDFVLNLPDVDPERIAVTGSSSGGTQTMALDACDPRAAVAFPMVMVGMLMQGGCVCENAPLYRIQTNNVEIASLFAPKPEGMAAANDWTVEFMKRGLPEMKQIWGLYGAADQVWGEHYDFGHNHNLHSREAQYNFLNRQLRLGWPEDPVKEKPFEPVPPKELSVYDPEHPRPADECDAPALRKYMTRTLTEQLGAMPNEEYVKTIRVALEAMIVDHKPSADEREFVGDAPAIPSSGGSWSGFIARKGSGERVPCKILQPANWNQSVVLWADPGGCKSVVADNPSVKRILDGGAAVLTIDPFMSDSFKPAPGSPSTGPRPRSNPNPPYAAYTLGYERSVIANRVHDLLTALGTAQAMSKDGSVKVIAFKDSGPAALLACAIASHHVSRAAIDLNQFDFDQITSDSDPMLLPGGLKYGGILGFVPLCNSGATLLCNARMSGNTDRPTRTPGVTIDPQPRDNSKLVDWILDSK
jgi:hypothetical protein